MNLRLSILHEPHLGRLLEKHQFPKTTSANMLDSKGMTGEANGDFHIFLNQFNLPPVMITSCKAVC